MGNISNIKHNYNIFFMKYSLVDYNNIFYFYIIILIIFFIYHIQFMFLNHDNIFIKIIFFIIHSFIIFLILNINF